MFTRARAKQEPKKERNSRDFRPSNFLVHARERTYSIGNNYAHDRSRRLERKRRGRKTSFSICEMPRDRSSTRARAHMCANKYPRVLLISARA